MVEVLRRGEKEHRMVRHECAEALGAVEEAWGECEEVLMEFLKDDDDCVRESCEVALDAMDYFGVSGGGNKEDADDFDDFGNIEEEPDADVRKYQYEVRAEKEARRKAKAEAAAAAVGTVTGGAVTATSTNFATEKNRSVANHFNVKVA